MTKAKSIKKTTQSGQVMRSHGLEDKVKWKREKEDRERKRDKMRALAGRYFDDDMLTLYLLSLDHPDLIHGAKVPYAGNLTATLSSTVGVTRMTKEFTCPPLRTAQWSFIPGHSNTGDPQEKFVPCYNLLAGGGTYCPGPVSGAHLAVGGLAMNVPQGECRFDWSGLGSGWPATADSVSGLAWDQTLPYSNTGVSSTGMRWRLVSMCVKFTNLTQSLEQAGSLVVVRMKQASNSALTSQAQLKQIAYWDRYPLEHQGSQTVVWTPLPEDLLFHHATDSAGVTQHWGVGGIHLFVNAGSQAVDYAVDVTANWELAGMSLATITTPRQPVKGTEETVKTVTEERVAEHEVEPRSALHTAMDFVGKHGATVVKGAKHAYSLYNTLVKSQPHRVPGGPIIPHGGI